MSAETARAHQGRLLSGGQRWAGPGAGAPAESVGASRPSRCVRVAWATPGSLNRAHPSEPSPAFRVPRAQGATPRGARSPSATTASDRERQTDQTARQGDGPAAPGPGRATRLRGRRARW